MNKHEEKKCARCNATFECKPGDIVHCQCYGIELNAEAEAFIQKQYSDCLCRNCLLQLQQSYFLFQSQPERFKNR
jgi:hypothetical protein